MKRSLLDILLCPSCGRQFAESDLACFEESPVEVESGLLACECGQFFPVMAGVPVMLTGELRGDYSGFLETNRKLIPKAMLARLTEHETTPVDRKVQVKESFGYKWQLLGNYGFDGPTKEFTAQWMYAGYGWGDEENFRQEMEKKRMFLDAGCGLGREVVRFCSANSAAPAVGIELSDCARLAYEKVRPFPNGHIIQADLMKLPLKKGCFDFILSEGVLHHTPDTKAAFVNVCSHLAPQGELAVYIYCIKPLMRELADIHVREETVGLTEQECWEYCRHLTSLGKKLQDIRQTITIDADIPILGIEKGTYTVQGFIYRYFLKCFWNNSFSFDENNLVNFDWYHPYYAFRHTPEELKAWASALGIQEMWFKHTESGMFFRGVKRS